MIRLWLVCAAALLAQDKPLVYLTARSQAPALTLEVVKPEGAGPFPVVLLVHGGGFTAGTPADMRPIAEQLRKAGLASALVSYRLAPRFQYPGPVQDLKAAVRYLRANAAKLGVNGERVCALGREAGGTLAELLGVTRGVMRFEGRPENKEFSSAVDCVVSMDAIPGTPAFLGTASPLAEADPAKWVTPDAPPVLRAGDPVPFLLQHLRPEGRPLDGAARRSWSWRGIDCDRLAVGEGVVACSERDRLGRTGAAERACVVHGSFVA